MPVKGFFRPSGAPCRTRLFPWLAPWATFSRPSGADAHESYQQNVETPGPSFARMHKAEPYATSYNLLMLTPTEKIWHNGRFIPWESATIHVLSLIHISEPTRRTPISYAVFC